MHWEMVVLHPDTTLGGPIFQFSTKLSQIILLPALQHLEATYVQATSSGGELLLCLWHLQARGQQLARRYLCWGDRRHMGREPS